MMRARPKNFAFLVGLLVATFAAGLIGSLATAENVRSWYPDLAKPQWTPPSWLFGPVWTALYIAMSVAAWRVWRIAQDGERSRVIVLYGIQLSCNAAWSILFFGLRRPDLALVDIAVLWALIVFALIRFWRADRLSGILWAPYVLWVTFASALNGAIWWLNR
jgi:benzodiazapine receptor